MLRVRTFCRSEDGAVTVDWVVLTAGILSIALATLSLMTSGTKTLTESVSSDVANRPISTSF